jgi:hypothetical protein
VAKRPKIAPGTLWWTHLPALVPGDSLDQTIQEAEVLLIKLLRMKADGLRIRSVEVSASAMGKLRVLVTDNPTVAKKWKMDDAAGSTASRPR